MKGRMRRAAWLYMRAHLFLVSGVIKGSWTLLPAPALGLVPTPQNLLLLYQGNPASHVTQSEKRERFCVFAGLFLRLWLVLG